MKRAMMTFGTAALAFGVATTLLAMASASLGVFFVGAIIAGAGFGAGFQGAIRSVLPLAAPRDRAGVLSVLYVIAYLAMGLPAVLGGCQAAPPGLAARDASGDPLCEHLVALLHEHRGNVTAVARAMGKARMQIQRWLKRYHLVPDEFRG